MATGQERQMRLGVFVQTPGHHVGGWRHPDAVVDGWPNLALMKHIAATAERGKFDMFFLGDGFATGYGEHPSTIGKFEPLTLLSALAMGTSRLGLAATGSTTYAEPYQIARSFASLDHLSGGRAAWNVVTTAYAKSAAVFGRQHPPHAERYAMAEEFVEACRILWDSWADDAFIADKKAGVFVRPGSLRVPSFQGKVLHRRRRPERAALAAGPSGADPGRLLGPRAGAGVAHRRRRVHRAERPRRGAGLLSRGEGAGRRVRPPGRRGSGHAGRVPRDRPHEGRGAGDLRRAQPQHRHGAGLHRAVGAAGRRHVGPSARRTGARGARDRASQEPRCSADRDGAARASSRCASSTTAWRRRAAICC